MKKISITIVASILLTLPCFAQNTTQNNHAITTTAINQREVTAYLEELTGTMINQLKQVQDENAALENRLNRMEQNANALEKENSNLKQEIANLKKQVSALTVSNESYEKTLKKISSNLDTLSSIESSGNKSTFQKNNSSSNVSTSYAEYEVQKGATLSAIAAAYGVTVNEIKKANNLKNDNLRIGQILKIPVR